METNSTIKIGTHDGPFHCDDVISCFMIKQLPQYSKSEIVRSRNPDRLNSCEIVFDVGGVYDLQKKRFDHHQQSFNLTLKDFFPNKTFGNIKLSSAGLIFVHYGHEIISLLLGWEKYEPRTDKIFDMVYENFIKEIDAIDNGINMYKEEPIYRINTHLSQRVSNLKPNWNEDTNDIILYERFLKAIDLTGKEFVECVNYYGKSWFPAREIVLESYEKRFEYDPKGRIMVLDHLLPWINHLFQIEQEHNALGQVIYVIYSENPNSYRVRSVPISEKSFDLRCPLPQSWRGYQEEDLCRIANIQDCLFVHSTGFIGGNKTLEGALQMAKKSLEN